MALKAIFFDLDDTLIDWSNFSADWREKEIQHLTGVYQYVTRNGGTISTTIATLQDYYNKQVREAWANARATLRSPHLGNVLMQSLAHFGLRESDRIDMRGCLEAYGWGAVPGVRVFPDVPEALETLRSHGIKVGIVTNAHQPITMRDIELAEYDLLRHFTDAPARICAADVGYIKPHPHIFRHALSTLDVTPEEAVFVGDNVVADIGGAQKVGIKAVLRVNHNEPLLSGMVKPDGKIRHLGELMTLLDDWFVGWR
jgi:putative hydrolase of the HAD superfamily